MTTKPTSRKRPTVHEVAGADDEVRGRVSSSADAVHGAAGNLREAVKDLHDARDEAWKRYAAEVEEATVRFDAAMDVATSRLRAERAETSEELAGDLRDLGSSWHGWADELGLQAHLGTMEARSFASTAVGRLTEAGNRLGALASTFGLDAGGSLAELRSRAAMALDEARWVFTDRPEDADEDAGS